jgi:dolichol kinase
MFLAMVIFLTVDFLRLHINPIKSIFIILFGSLLRKKEFTSLTGGSYLMLASFINMLIFEDKGIFMASIAFLAVGDTMAALVGLTQGRTRIFALKKTLEGTIACFLSCTLVAYLLSVLPQHNLPLKIGLIGAGMATLIEIIPLEVNDNVLIPLGSAIAMQIFKMIST